MLDFWFVLLALTCIVIFNSVLNQKKKKGHAPGPWALPILGHLPFLGMNPPKKLVQWKEYYGPIMSIQFGSFPLVVLNDAKLIREAFNLNSLIGRPRLRPLFEGCEAKGLAFTDGQAVTELRQFVFKHLKDFGYGSKSMGEKLQEEAVELLDHIKINVGKTITVNGMFSKFVVNGLWSIVMGEKFQGEEVNHLAHMVTTRISRADTLISKLAMCIPWMSTLAPELSGHKDKVEAFREVYSFAQSRVEQTKLTWVKNQPRHLTDAFLDKMDDTTDINSCFHPSEGQVQKVTGDLFMGGVETSGTVLDWMINYLGRNLQVQKKLQKEIDEVIGSTRIPCLSDRPQMPYAEATVMELLRIVAPLPLALFHRALEDIEFHGYKIPKDTNVVGNIFGCHHDKTLWENPEQFLPERFIGVNGKLVKNENFIAFAPGKRSCVGEGLARDTLFLFTMTIFQRFHVEFPKDAKEVKGYFGLTWTAETFQVIFTERN